MKKTYGLYQQIISREKNILKKLKKSLRVNFLNPGLVEIL
jgi:hypothetical protein